MLNVTVPTGTALGTYSIPVTATDAQGNTASATISVTVQNLPSDAQLNLNTSVQGDMTTTVGWQIINGGTGYTVYSTLEIDGQAGSSPYGAQSITCTLTLDANGTITGVSGGEGVQWYGPPEFTLTR